MEQSRLERAARLALLMQSDPDVRTMVSATCRERGVVSLGHLADAMPDVFDELAEVVEDMLDQLPTMTDR